MGIYKLQRVYYKRETVEYPEGLVKFESSTPGTYTVNLVRGQYEIICVGGGGGGVRWIAGPRDDKAGGGSGGYSNLTQNLIENSYNIAVGGGGGWTNQANRYAGTGGTSSFSDIVNATGGQGGYRFQSCSGGTGITQNGNGGTPSAAGASVYNGYGSGGYGASNGGAGYVKIICYSEETIVPGTADDYDFYEDKMLKIGEFYKGSTKIGSLYKGSVLVFGKTQTIFEETTPGIYTITIPYEADFKITAVGAGGRANYRCAYDDRGYIGCGGSGGAFIGKIHLTPGRYDVQIGSCAAGSSRTTFINEVLTVGGGGDGATNPIGGAAGAAPILNITPVSEELNTAGNAGGAYSSGNGGGGSTWNYGGAASVYGGYGRGGGGKVCEYSWASSANEGSGEPYNPTNGYLKIEL